jgi:glutathione peroxidase
MSAYDFTVKDADGAGKELGTYADKAMLIVNVASRCGLTPQYDGLEALHRDLADRGLRVVGFPCNQFGAQEPGTDAEIQQFCKTSYDVTFPVLAKIDVNGPDADPLYEYLREEQPGDIRWNFTKFLVDGDGKVVARYEPTVTPEELRPDIERLLTSG